MAYVYRHIRLDTNQPFYIGIGSDLKYSRALTLKGRNLFWTKTVAKGGFSVDIIFDDLTWDQACEKEKEFIKLYGRRDNNTGVLVNLTDGGDGSNGLVQSQETIQKKIQSLTGKKRTPAQIEVLKKASVGRNKGRVLSDDHKEKIRLNGIGKNKGKTHSEETKEKIRAKRALQINVKGIQKGHIPWNKGIKTGNAWNKGKSPSIEVREKIRQKLLGSKLSPESIAKRTATRKANGLGFGGNKIIKL